MQDEPTPPFPDTGEQRCAAVLAMDTMAPVPEEAQSGHSNLGLFRFTVTALMVIMNWDACALHPSMALVQS